MANDIVQTIAEARVDARSLSEFVFKPADFMVARRLAPSVRTLQYYVDFFNTMQSNIATSVSAAQSSLNSSVAEAQGKVAYIESTVQDAINNTAIEGGVLADTFVTVTASAVGSVARTQRDKNADLIHAKDFGLVGDGVTDESVKLQNALSANGILELTKDAVYIISEPIIVHNSISGINGNGAKIIFSREQLTTSANTPNSLLYNFARTKPLEVNNLILEYTGTFSYPLSYSGLVCGIDIRAATEFSGLYYKNIKASGFNRAGVQVGFGGEYIKNVVVADCVLSENRVAGLWFGNVDGIVIERNRCERNGLSTDAGTGYGLAGVSAFYPKNVTIVNNYCNYNHRKGIDTHGGYNIYVENNECTGNKYYGIAIQNRNNIGGVIKPMGTITVKSNTISDMHNESNPVHPDMFGIVIGKYQTGELEDAPLTKFIVADNIISNFTTTGTGGSTPLSMAPQGLNKVSVIIKGNDFNVGKVGYILSITGAGSVSEGSGETHTPSLNCYSEYKIEGNSFVAESVISGILRVPLKTGVLRIAYNNNYLEVKGTVSAGMSDGLINLTNDVFPNSIVPVNAALSLVGNTVVIPAITTFTQDIAINYSLPHITQSNNLFNGKPWRSYKNKVYTHEAEAIPTEGLWTIGSIVRNQKPVVGSPAAWICTKTGIGTAAKWGVCALVESATIKTGTTALRPTGVVVGYQYFDTDLGKPIYFKSTGVWVDSTGVTV